MSPIRAQIFSLIGTGVCTSSALAPLIKRGTGPTAVLLLGMVRAGLIERVGTEPTSVGGRCAGTPRYVYRLRQGAEE